MSWISLHNTFADILILADDCLAKPPHSCSTLSAFELLFGKNFNGFLQVLYDLEEDVKGLVDTYDEWTGSSLDEEYALPRSPSVRRAHGEVRY